MMNKFESIEIYICRACEVTWNSFVIGKDCFNCRQPGEFEKNAIMDSKGTVFPPSR